LKLERQISQVTLRISRDMFEVVTFAVRNMGSSV